MNFAEMLRTARLQLRSQTPAQRVLRTVLALALSATLVLTVLPEWNVVLVALGIAIIGAVLTVVIPNSITPLIFLLGILANWVLRSSGELGPIPIAVGGCLLVVLVCLVGCTLAPTDVRLPRRVWTRLGVAALVGIAVLAATSALQYALVAVEVPGLMPLLLLAVLLVPIMVWLLLRPRPADQDQ